MNKIQIYIDNQLADFSGVEDIDILIEKNVDVFEASQSQFTYGINFPRTAPNELVFKHIVDKMKIDKFTPSYVAEIVINTTSVLKGTAKVREITREYIRVNIVSDVISILDKLGSKSLREIQSFAPVNFQGAETIDDIITTKGNNTLSDIAFPLVSYGNFYYGQATFDSLNNADPNYYQNIGKALGQQNLLIGGLFFTDFPPAVYVVNILKKIFEDIGYTLAGELMADSDINKLILLYTGEREPEWNWKYLANFEHQDLVTKLASEFVAQYINCYSYTPPVSGEYILNLKIEGKKNKNVTDPTEERVLLVIQMSDQPLSSPFQYIGTGDTSFINNDPAVIHYNTALASLVNPSPFSIVGNAQSVYLQGNQTVYLWYYGLNLLAKSQVDKVEFEVVQINDKDEFLHVEKQLPDVQQADFVRSFIKMFNVVTTIDENIKTVYFSRKSAFYKGVSEKLAINEYANRDRAKETPIDEDQLKKVKYYFDENDFFQKEDAKFFGYHNQKYDENNNIELIFSPTAFRVFFKLVGASAFKPIVLPSITDQEGINRNVLDSVKASSFNYDFAPRILKYVGLSGYTDPNSLDNKIYISDYQGTLLDPTPIALCTFFDRSTQIYYRVDYSNIEQVWKTFYLDAFEYQKLRLSAAYLNQNELSLTYNENWTDLNTLKKIFYKAFDSLTSSHLVTVEAVIPEDVFVQLTGERLIEFFYDIYYLQSVKKYDPKTGECELQLIKKV